MVLPDDSWHIKYFEFSYFYYIGWTTVLVFIYSVYYCIRAPRSIGRLKDILDQDPIINGFEFKEPAKKSQKIVFSSTSVPQHNLPQNREKNEKKEATAATKELKNNETPVPIEKVRRTLHNIHLILNNSSSKLFDQQRLLRDVHHIELIFNNNSN